MQPHVMHCLVSLAPGGAERLALTILDRGRDRLRGSVCGLMRGTGVLVPDIEALGLPWHVLTRQDPGRIAAWRNLHRLLRRERVDVLHVHAGYLLSFILPVAKLAGVPVIYTEHARYSLERQPRLQRMVRLAAPFLQAVTCVTENLRTFMVERLGLSAQRIRVIPNGVDLERFQPAPVGRVPGKGLPEDWAGPGITVFGNVARFTEAKDHPGLLRAFDAVRRESPGARLLLVGDGETRSEIEGLVRDLGLGGHVHLTGMRQDVPDLLGNIDVFVLSSKREGLPVSVLEAMAAGLPVITTDVGGICEVVEDGVTARIVPPEDMPGLGRAMRWMLGHPGDRAAMAARGRDLVRARYGHDRMLASYLDLYRKVGAAA